MYQYIENLRKKPDHHKKRVAFVAAGAITGAMFLAWVSVVLPSNTQTVVADNTSAPQVQTTVANTKDNTTTETPLDGLKASVATAVDSIKSLFQKKADDFNFDDEYSKMKDQVQSGQIQIAPPSTAGTQ